MNIERREVVQFLFFYFNIKFIYKIKLLLVQASTTQIQTKSYTSRKITSPGRWKITFGSKFITAFTTYNLVEDSDSGRVCSKYRYYTSKTTERLRDL